jgi:hypothetical protein
MSGPGTENVGPVAPHAWLTKVRITFRAGR